MQATLPILSIWSPGTNYFQLLININKECVITHWLSVGEIESESVSESESESESVWEW